MSTSASIKIRSANTPIWRGSFERFLENRRRNATWPEESDLSPRQSWQRRITGGTLLQFYEYITGERISEQFPFLLERPLVDRVFVFVTDFSGIVAARDLIDPHSEQAEWVTREEWAAWLADELCDHDDDFAHHYECWSVWHQEVDPSWEFDAPEGWTLWVHEEGWAIADGAGRGAQNLWGWDGQQMRLVKQDMTSWTS